MENRKLTKEEYEKIKKGFLTALEQNNTSESDLKNISEKMDEEFIKMQLKNFENNDNNI